MLQRSSTSMQFHFPQFIDIEDKIFGPLTFKQAIYVAGGVGGSYFIYRLFPSYTFISIPIIVGIIGLTWALAFFPKEKLGKPFIEILQAGISFLLKEKLYIWKKIPKTPKKTEIEFTSSKNAPPPQIPTVRQGTLSSISFSLDIKGSNIEERPGK